MSERSFYLDCNGEAVFTVHHEPTAGEGGTAILLLPPFGWEEVASYRARREWALHLAGRGHHVVRLDLPGTGDSAGELGDAGRLASWQEAAKAAALWLRGESGAPRLAAIGIGTGGYLAWELVAHGDADDAVVWATPKTGKRFVRELSAFGTLEASRIVEAGGPPSPVDPPGIEAGGFLLSDELAADIGRLELRSGDVPPGARLLFLDRDGAGAVGSLVDELQAAGVEVTTAAGVGYAAMLAQPDKAKPPREVFQTVDEWLAAGIVEPRTADGTRAAPVRAELATPELREQPFGIRRPSGVLRGVLAEPAAGDRAALTLVFLNAGAVRRTGPHRFWVEAARRWARDGVASVRVDLEGIGDADGDGDVYDDVSRFHDPQLVDHVSAVLDDLVERGLPDRFVLIGLCSGGFWGFQTALRDARVAAAVMVNTRILYWHPHIDAFRDLHRTRLLVRATTWRRLLRGEVSVARVAHFARSLVSSAATRLRGGEGADAASVFAWQARNVTAAFTTLRDAGRSAYFLFCSGENLDEELERAGLFAQPDRWPNVRRIRIPGRDHTLNPIWMHAPASAALDEAIDAERARIGAQ
jgi:dienelactone hydrolase